MPDDAREIAEPALEQTSPDQPALDCRFIVTITTKPWRTPWIYLVNVAGSKPELAVEKALSWIAADEQSDLGQTDDLTISVKRLR